MIGSNELLRTFTFMKFYVSGLLAKSGFVAAMGEAEEVIERKGRRNNEVHLKEQVKLTEIYLILAYKSLANRR